MVECAQYPLPSSSSSISPPPTSSSSSSSSSSSAFKDLLPDHPPHDYPRHKRRQHASLSVSSSLSSSSSLYDRETRPKQPFHVRVHPDVTFLCDLHAHLATCEIIGFLAGKFDRVRNTLFIHAAFPCRSMDVEDCDGSMDVEMDPTSEVTVTNIIHGSIDRSYIYICIYIFHIDRWIHIDGSISILSDIDSYRWIVSISPSIEIFFYRSIDRSFLSIHRCGTVSNNRI
jgi:hypothetical protein